MIALVGRAVAQKLLHLGRRGKNSRRIEIGSPNELAVAGLRRRRNVQDAQMIQDEIVNIVVMRSLREDGVFELDMGNGMRSREKAT